ncbi:hypothetical protein [Kurthia massiliensis]|uniref:hypothetical protein n=1 Tax=Kurthia massiliensis TaxID=1033739 RepID=UPI0002896EBF|nr:hypothetical protein [Kurthia massiliensis]
MKRIIRHATLQDADQIAAIHTVCKAELNKPITSQNSPIRFEYDIALWKIYLQDDNYRVLVLEDRIIIGFILAHQPADSEQWLVADAVVLPEYTKPHDREMLYDSLMKDIYPIVNDPIQLADAL